MPMIGKTFQKPVSEHFQIFHRSDRDMLFLFITDLVDTIDYVGPTIENTIQKFNMNKPLVSIITPVFNQEKFISDAIESVLSQSYDNWELLIINDGSTDDSEKIITSFTDQRISYFSQTNKRLFLLKKLRIVIA